MFSPVFSSQFKPALAPALQPVFALNKITRYIATLKASDGGYIKLKQSIELQAGDDVEWIGQMDSGSQSRYALDGVDDSNNRCYFLFGGLLRYNTLRMTNARMDGVTFSDGDANPSDGKVHVFNFTITATCYIGSMGAKFDATEFLDQAFLGLIVRRNGNVIHNISTDVAKGTTIIPNLAQPLGSELVDFTSATGRSAVLTDISTNAVTVTNNIAEYGTTEQVIDFEKGTYLLQVRSSDNSAHSSGGAFTVTPNNWTDKIYHSSLQNGDNTLIFNVPSAGSYEIWFHVGANNLGESQIFSDVSIKKAPNWAEYVNVADDNKELYTWDAERNSWVGSETGKILEVAQ